MKINWFIVRIILQLVLLWLVEILRELEFLILLIIKLLLVLSSLMVRGVIDIRTLSDGSDFVYIFIIIVKTFCGTFIM